MLVPNFQLLTCTRHRDAQGLAAPWTALIARALVPSGLNSPEMLVPLLKHLPVAELATVEQGGELAFALPVRRRRWPVPFLTNWITPLTISGLPHVDANLAEPAITAFLRAAGQPVLLRSIPADGPFWSALTAAAPHLKVLNRWQRASLRISGTYADWFERNFDRKRRKEFRRLKSRLGEKGELICRNFVAGEDTAPWTKGLIDLEAAGWKGEKGTALKSDPAIAAAATEALANLGHADKLRFWELRLDGKVIASMFAMVEGTDAWLGKIAYDESLARYSPGVLLVLHATECLFAEGAITHIDSSAIPNHPMIDSLWRDRVAMADVLVASSEIPGPVFWFLCGAEILHRRLRATAANLYYSMTGKHRS